MQKVYISLTVFVLALTFNSIAFAGLPAYKLTVKDGHFEPKVIKVPAKTRFKLVITNLGPGPEEFESKELRKESVIAEGVTRSVVFAPLKPGKYRFFGDFHVDTAQGFIIVE